MSKLRREKIFCEFLIVCITLQLL